MQEFKGARAPNFHRAFTLLLVSFRFLDSIKHNITQPSFFFFFAFIGNIINLLPIFSYIPK